jgi:hypothetical protein
MLLNLPLPCLARLARTSPPHLWDNPQFLKYITQVYLHEFRALAFTARAYPFTDYRSLILVCTEPDDDLTAVTLDTGNFLIYNIKGHDLISFQVGE